MFWSNLWTLFFILLCSGGFIWQEMDLSQLYFAYDVTTTVSIDVPLVLNVPGVSACYKYTDILMYEKLNAMNSSNYDGSIMSDYELDQLQQKLTIEDVFNLTPDSIQSFDSCRVKIPKTYKIATGTNASACLEMFKIHKFFFVEYMCYRYEYILKPDLFLYEELANTPKLSGVMYEVTPGNAFKNYHYAKFVLHTGNVFPAKSVGLSPVMDRGDSWVNESVNSATYFIIYFKLKKKRLPPPRTTNCQDYNVTMGHQSQAACRQACIKSRSTNLLKRVPFSSIQTTPTKLKAVSYLDILDENIRTKTFKFLNDCNTICLRQDCAERTTFNRISYQKSQTLKIQVMIPEEPWIDVVYKPIMTSTEYVTYVLSCFGTWFGLSVLTLNPFSIGSKLLRQWRARQIGDVPVTPNGFPYKGGTGARGKVADDLRSGGEILMMETIRKLDIVFARQCAMDTKYDRIIGAINTMNPKSAFLFSSTPGGITSLHQPYTYSTRNNQRANYRVAKNGKRRAEKILVDLPWKK